MSLRPLPMGGFFLCGVGITYLTIVAVYGQDRKTIDLSKFKGKVTGATTFVPAPTTPIDNRLATGRGCRTGGPGDINRTDPSWVSVDPADTPKVVEGYVVDSRVTPEDFPFNHDSHDHNGFILPLPHLRHMMSDANHGAGDRDHRQAVEIEWETRYYPMSAWPAPGDYGWVIGRHIFDCGHPPYKTEIHPPIGTAYTRLDPVIMPPQTTPSLVNRTFIFFGNQGGYYVHPVGGRNYTFNVPLPPKPPGPGVTPFARVTRTTTGMPAPTSRLVTVGTQQMMEITVPLAGVSDPTRKWDLYEWIHRPNRPGSIDRPTNVFQYEAVVATGWNPGPALSSTPGFRQIRVTFDNVKVHSDHDTFSGEWNMYLRANGHWFKVPKASVDDGSTIRIGRTAQFIIPEDGMVSIFAHGWEDDNDGHFRVGKPPGITDITALNENQALGKVANGYKAPLNFGVGTHSVKSSSGDYTLTYRIEQVQRWAPINAGGAAASPGGVRTVLRPPK